MTSTVETINLKKTYMLGKVPVNALCGVSLKVDVSKLNDNQLADLRRRIGFVFHFSTLFRGSLQKEENYVLSEEIWKKI